MKNSNLAFEEACRMVGECCLMFASNGEEISRARVALWLARAREEAPQMNGEQEDPLLLAINFLKGG
ncbi:hypothetical protein ASE99_02915 [Serratia sp. Leaf51]|nr:hypothetical protein ASE99_02915 [Serratia sp. Leaf51]